MFNAIDPSPFHDRDLDPSAEDFIVAWVAELPRSAPLCLRVTLDAPGNADDAEVLEPAVHQYFGRRASAERRRLRELFGRGRISLVIGLAFLAASTALASAVAPADSQLGAILQEGLLIGGWVAMWRPIEVFLYDWWPIRAQARLYDRLATASRTP
jgi:hypothetical protein